MFQDKDPAGLLANGSNAKPMAPRCPESSEPWLEIESHLQRGIPVEARKLGNLNVGLLNCY